MKNHLIRLLAIVLLAPLLPTISVHAEVVRYFAKTNARGEMTLVGVTLVGGGRTVTFDADKLIGVSVIHFRSNDPTNLATVAGAAAPPNGQRAGLLTDMLLNTGLLNPGGHSTPLATDPVLDGPERTPGLAVRFARPVVNRPGDDVLVFELHRELNSPLGGDAFHVGPLEFRPGLKSVTFETFDIFCDDPTALPLAPFDLYRLAQPPQSCGDLERLGATKANGAPNADFKILAVGVDLTELGYADGEEVAGLFFQDQSGAGLQFDPVLIAGLPAAEPPNLLAEIPQLALSGPQPGEMLDRMLAGPMAGLEEIVFAERVGGFDHWYANFGHYSAAVAEYPPQRGVQGETMPALYGEGGRLCRLNLRTGLRTVLLDDPAGGVRDPQVDYDGAKILFSYRRGNTPYYHLYEIKADGSGLTQLTDGPFDDIEPTYLADGRIVFCSSRCNRFVNCHRTPVANLYRCDGHGGNIQPLSANIEHDNTPWVLPDGRLLFMRWEYVDRSQFSFHHLWTMNPDGTGQMAYYGNQFDGVAMLDAKPIPGTRKVVASFSPSHGVPGHMGHVTVIDPSRGPDNAGGARRISRGKLYRDPYPFSEACFLVADDTGIHLMDELGNTELVYRPRGSDARLTCHEPRPLRPRPREAVLPSRTDSQVETGRLFLSDIYTGRNMAGVRRGEIKSLLVLEQLPKPINFSGGMWPTSAGGSFTLSRILGAVPVEADGSAYLELPAMRPLFFVALDENGLAVKRMQSFVSVAPGETTGCVGCHEQRLRPPLVDMHRADFLDRKPSRPKPFQGIADVFDFPRDIQPILDRHCLACHDAAEPAGMVDLSGDHTPLFSSSYWTLVSRGLISDGRNERQGNRPPRTIGSSASRLLGFLDGSHEDVEMSQRERTTIRLWIDASAVYAGTYAALGSGMSPVEFPLEVMERRCGECHGHEPTGKRIGEGRYFRFGARGPPLPLVHEFLDLQQIRGSIGYYKFGNARPPQSLCNLTRPAMSLLLRAPLPCPAGGLGLCGSAVFEDTSDADYQVMLARIVSAGRLLREEKRFDMPGFHPNVYYVRKLREYGVLPSDLADDAPIDVYAADEAYWRTFWYRPGKPPE